MTQKSVEALNGMTTGYYLYLFFIQCISNIHCIWRMWEGRFKKQKTLMKRPVCEVLPASLCSEPALEKPQSVHLDGGEMFLL